MKNYSKSLKKGLIIALVALIAYLGGGSEYFADAFDFVRDKPQSVEAGKTSMGEILTGKIVKVSDGDTVVLEDEQGTRHKIRLDGIDCPEVGQSFGDAATSFVRKYCLNKKANIEIIGRDQYKRILAIMHVGDININESLLENGLAWQYKYNKNPDYRELVSKAKRKRLNIWSEPSPINPYNWRKENK